MNLFLRIILPVSNYLAFLLIFVFEYYLGYKIKIIYLIQLSYICTEDVLLNGNLCIETSFFLPTVFVIFEKEEWQKKWKW